MAYSGFLPDALLFTSGLLRTSLHLTLPLLVAPGPQHARPAVSAHRGSSATDARRNESFLRSRLAVLHTRARCFQPVSSSSPQRFPRQSRRARLSRARRRRRLRPPLASLPRSSPSCLRATALVAVAIPGRVPLSRRSKRPWSRGVPRLPSPPRSPARPSSPRGGAADPRRARSPKPRSAVSSSSTPRPGAERSRSAEQPAPRRRRRAARRPGPGLRRRDDDQHRRGPGTAAPGGAVARRRSRVSSAACPPFAPTSAR